MENPPQRVLWVEADGTVKIDDAWMENFRNIFGSRKMHILTICGAYRTGKSFLLNQIAQAPGFEVAGSVNACTDGIWAWPAEGGAESGEGWVMLDCEGSGNTEHDRSHDAKIFALAAVVSSLFIFNSKGVIDEQAVQHLSLVAALADHISSKAEGPGLMWVLRDFCLALEDQAGNLISADEYMESALDPSGARKQDGKESRNLIKKLFSQRYCFPLVAPCIDEEALQNLEISSGIRPEFTSAVSELRTEIVRNCPVKAVNGVALTGIALPALLHAAAAAFNDGEAPKIDSVW